MSRETGGEGTLATDGLGSVVSISTASDEHTANAMAISFTSRY